MVQTGNFIPFAQIMIDVKTVDWRYPVRNTDAPGEDQYKKSKKLL
jgi:hypothetical protein